MQTLISTPVNYKYSGQLIITSLFSTTIYVRYNGDKVTGLMQHYSIGYPRILTTLCDVYSSVTNPTSFSRPSIQTNSVPSSNYIALIKIKKGAFQQCSITPVNFGFDVAWVSC
jgi:hypothetical protein